MPQWIKFQLIERPYYDRHGNILSSITGRRNRKGIDEFTGGGKVYPEIIIEKGKIKEWHEKDGVLLLQVDIPEAEAKEHETKDEKRKYKASPKIEKEYNYKDFKAKVITDQEAEDLKINFFGIKKLESGVTQ